MDERRRFLISYAIAAAATAAALFIRWLLSPLLDHRLPFITLYGAVAFAVWSGGWRPALLATALGYVVAQGAFVETEPHAPLSLTGAGGIAGLVVYLLSCLVVIGLGSGMNAARVQAEAAALEALARQKQLENEMRQHQKTELALRAKEAELELIASRTPLLLIRCSRDGRYLFVNRASAEFLGRQPEEIIGRRLQEILGEEAVAAIRPHIERVLRGEQVEFEMEIPYARPGQRFMHAIYTPDRDERGQVIGWVASITDVSERKRVEEARRESEERSRQSEQWLASQAEASQVALSGAPLEASLEVLVRTAAEQLGPGTRAAFYLANPEGTALRHVVGAPQSCAQRVDDFKIGPDSIACGLATFSGQPVVTADVDTDPSWKPWLWLARECQFRGCWNFPVQTSAGKVVGTFAMYLREPREPTPRDHELARIVTRTAAIIIARSQDQQQVAHGEERIRSVVDHVIDGIITIDARGTVESFNPAAEQLFGYRKAEVIGQNVKMLMPEPFHGQHDRYIANYLTTGEAKIIGVGREVVGQRKDGSTFPMDLAVSEFQIGPHRYFTGIVRDITERKRLEQELRQRLEELAEADRRKDEFLATLAHELRNPLAPVGTAVQILQLKGPSNPESQWACDVIDRQMRQMTRLIDDLLDLSRITRNRLELRKERVELAKVLQGAVETSRPLIDGLKHELTVALPPEAIYLDADFTRLAQVFANLLNNAAKYSEPGSRIYLTAERQGSDAVVAVRDTGIGIPKQMLEQIFDMFTQVDRSLERTQGGLGIGLTLVKRLVVMHGGSVTAQSDGPGAGSEFIVRLPIPISWSLPTPEPEPTYEERPATAPAPRRILIVDDNNDAATSLSKMLSLLGYEARTAGDGVAGLAAFAEFRPEAALLDIGMPKMNGYELARQIRQQPRGDEVVLIAITGWGQDEDKQRTVEAGFDHHLVKPVNFAALTQLLASATATPAAD